MSSIFTLHLERAEQIKSWAHFFEYVRDGISICGGVCGDGFLAHSFDICSWGIWYVLQNNASWTFCKYHLFLFLVSLAIINLIALSEIKVILIFNFWDLTEIKGTYWLNYSWATFQADILVFVLNKHSGSILV